MSTHNSAKVWTLGLTALVAAAQVGPVFSQTAQSAISSRALKSSSISSFVSEFGTPIIVGSRPLNPPPDSMAYLSPRLTKLASLVSTAGLTWHKIYRVTPATANAPVTTVAQARDMVDENSEITLNVNAVPASRVEKLISNGDNAIATFPDGLPSGNVTLSLGTVDISDAIAAIASATHTHWLAAYYVAPETPQVVSHPTTVIAYVPPMTQQEYEERYLFNGPFTLHSAPPPPVSTVTQAAPGDKNPANGLAPLTMPAPQAAQTIVPQDLLPAVVNDPYGYSGMMYAPDYSYGGTTVINPF